jgi:hypothetical protein
MSGMIACCHEHRCRRRDSLLIFLDEKRSAGGRSRFAKCGTVVKGSVVDLVFNDYCGAKYRAWSTTMALSALDLTRELDRQKLAILQHAGDEALTKASEALRELKEVVREQLKMSASQRPNSGRM